MMKPIVPETSAQRAAAARSQRLATHYLDWCRRPALRHAACLALLTFMPLLRWSPALASREPLGDEPAYRAAFTQVAAGASPYVGTDYVYPAAFAFAGAWSAAHVGLESTMYLLRAANLAGLAVVVWCSLAWLSWPLPHRLVVGSAFVLLAPQVAHSVLLGNLSLAVSGLVIAGLLLVPKAPLVAGCLLGASLALKPIAPMIVPSLLAAVDRDERRARLVAGGAALVLTLALVLLFPYARELVALQETSRVATTVSLHRIPRLLGYQINALWISAPLALAALAVLRRRPLGHGRFLCFATTASVVVLPVVWSHTLILTLPLQVLALTVAADRLRSGAGREHAPRGLPWWLEPALVALAVASLQFAAGAGAIDDQGVVIQAAGALLPALAPIGLLAYLLAYTEAF
jgi:hypothetical protein